MHMLQMFARRLTSLPARVPGVVELRAGLATKAPGGRRPFRYVLVGGLAGAGVFAYTFRETEAERSVRAQLAQAEQDGGLHFRNTEVMFRTRSTTDIMTSLLVFKVCSMSWLVAHADQLLELCQTLRITAPVYWGIRRTFFRYFCAGETAEDAWPTLEQLTRNGVRSVLDLSVEADEGSRGSVEQCDQLALRIINGLQAAARQPNNFMAVKVTALTNPDTLAKMSERLTRVDSLFKAMDAENRGAVSLQQFSQGLASAVPQLSTEEGTALFHMADTDNNGLVDLLDLHTALSLSTANAVPLLDANAGVPQWDTEDVAAMGALLARMESICVAASKVGVRIMVDAEQSYFQPAIDHVARRLQSRFNRDTTTPLVYNTHQMYLKNQLDRLKLETEMARREGWLLAVKLVRGAYMVSERRRALELGIESPVCDTKAETDANYNGGVAHVLEVMAATTGGRTVGLMVATHNETSTLMAVKQARALGVPVETSRGLCFAQLLSMCDHISYTLASAGIPVAKYVPYGPVRDTMPYLIRRAQENSAVLGNNHIEALLLWMELKSRLRAPFSANRVAHRVLPSTNQK